MSTATIYLTTTPEPGEYHLNAADQSRVSVHLAYDGDSAETAPLLKIAKWSFTVYRVAPTATAGLFEARKESTVKVEQEWVDVRSIAANDVLDWIEERGGFASASTQKDIVEAGDVRCRELLLGSASWTAPVAHAAHLMRIVGLKRDAHADTTRLILLPVDYEPVEKITIDTTTGGTELLTVPLKGGELDGVTVRTNFLLWDFDRTLPKTRAEALDPKAFPVPVRSDGFIFSVRSEEDYRVLKKFESAAASLFSTLPALLELDSDLITGLTAKSLARLGCAVALDPLWLSLLYPGADLKEGATLAPLMRICELEEQDPAVRTGFLKWVRKGVRAITLRELLDIEKPLLQDVFTLPGDKDSFTDTIQRLRTFLAWLQQEEGLETVLTRVLTFIQASAPEALKEKYHRWLAAYFQQLQTAFNAADAVRYDCGVLMSSWLTPESLAIKRPLIDTTQTADTYFQRLQKPAVANAWSKRFVGSLIATDDKLDDPKGKLHDAWQRAVARALEGKVRNEPPRFHPDSSPQPIPLPIAASDKAELLSEFTERFNGVAVLLRSKAGKWAHVNLAALQPLVAKEYPKNDWAPGKFAVRPILPVCVDGRHELFLQYHGIPLSSPAYEATNGPGTPSAEPHGFQRAFYLHRDVAFAAEKYEKPPCLAYGQQYESCVFALTRSGALPKRLQDAKTPWLPTDEIDLTGVALDEVLAPVDHQRRTAIGSLTIGPNSGPQRIAKSYPEVYPLAQDFPRLALTSGLDRQDFLDLFRGPDGFGLLRAPSAERPVLITLGTHYLIAKSGVEKVTVEIEVHENANVLAESRPVGYTKLADGKLADLLKLDWTVEIVAKGGTLPDPAVGKVQLQLDREAKQIWIRVKLSSTAGDVCWSFTRPESSDATTREGSSSEVPLLLVAEPDDDGTWDRTLTDPVNTECVLSSTTWPDWERWFNNPDNPINGKTRAELPKANRTVKALLDASLMRGEDTDGDLSKLLDRLPDPAVVGVLVELSQVDAIDLGRETEWSVPPVIVPVPDWMNSIEPPYWNIAPEMAKPEDYLAYFSNLKNYLETINRVFRIPLTVTCAGAKLDKSKDGLTVSVPAGSVAKLTLRPLVAKQSFGNAPAPIVAEMIQLASGSYQGKYQIFPGAELLIEGMANAKWEPASYGTYDKIVERYLKVHCSDNSRTYRIIQAAPSPDQAVPTARYFARIEIRTQRFRFSGRPIYSWLDPTKFNRSGTNIAMELGDTNGSRKEKVTISDFESQLFFERDDQDCELVRTRLLGPGHELTTFTWERPSATYYRHGFSLVSRYSGALRRGNPIWPPTSPTWSRRCAILAEANRIELTRPQVRCLIPLSQDPIDFSTQAARIPVIEPQFPEGTPLAPSPPLICVLEERPFDVGGLAERVISELITGVGYGFESNKAAVQPIDLTKETSRDPRIDTRSWKYDRLQRDVDPSHLMVLEQEGPIGLHFDRATAPAPAWSNSQFLLKPRTLDGRFLPEESFVAVRMRRVLDPAWVFDPRGTNKIPTKGLSLEASYQAAAAKSIVGALMTVEGGDQFKWVLSAKEEGSYYVLSINRQALGSKYKQNPLKERDIAPLEGYQESALILAAIPRSKMPVNLRLLHTTQGDGRYSLSVLADVQQGSSADAIDNGHGAFPVLLTSIDWKADAIPELQGKPLSLRFDDGFQISPLTASSCTFQEWGRTAKNCDWVHCIAEKDSRQFSIRELRARRIGGDDTRLAFCGLDGKPLWLTSSLAESRQPLHIQRHLVAMLTKRSEGPGRQFDLYHGAKLLTGRQPAIDSKLLSGAARMELHELEVPAAIVAGGAAVLATPALNVFQAAFLDLSSTGGRPTKEKVRQYKLHIRFANAASSLAGAKDLKVVVSVPDAASPNGRKSICEMKCIENIRAADICLDSQAGAHIRRHDANGGLQTESRPGPTADMSTASTLIVTLEAPAALSEVWADVSLLHTIKRDNESLDPDRFDFDWLFSEEEEEPPATTRVLPQTLSGIFEAQARLISASRPIDLLSAGT